MLEAIKNWWKRIKSLFNKGWLFTTEEQPVKDTNDDYVKQT